MVAELTRAPLAEVADDISTLVNAQLLVLDGATPRAAHPLVADAVLAPMTAQAATNRPTPTADAVRATRRGSRVVLVVAIPIRAPSAISHPRVNVEK